jgi:putative chitinase
MPDLHGLSRACFEAALRKLWPQGDRHIPGLRQAMAEQITKVASKWGFDSEDVVAIFMGQVSLECGAGLEVVENLNYTAKRMMAVWPKRFPTLASAMPYAGNPKALANKTYNGRMGNRPGSDDGWNYRGRGGTQTTGHDGYEATGRAVGLDLLSDPDLVNTPEHFLETAAADFVKCGCLPFAGMGTSTASLTTSTAALQALLIARRGPSAGVPPLAPLPHQRPPQTACCALGRRGMR